MKYGVPLNNIGLNVVGVGYCWSGSNLYVTFDFQGNRKLFSDVGVITADNGLGEPPSVIVQFDDQAADTTLVELVPDGEEEARLFDECRTFVVSSDRTSPSVLIVPRPTPADLEKRLWAVEAKCQKTTMKARRPTK